jgi:hypothetical protein
MPLITRYLISDLSPTEVRSSPALTELPYFMRHHESRLRYVDDMVAVVSNRKHRHPTFVRLNAFHSHETSYAAIDALAPPLAEFFMQSDILPLIEPIFLRFKERMQEWSPDLFTRFAERGILIPRELPR